MTTGDVPTVFVIDDDALVRAAIHGMLKSVGLHSVTFGDFESKLGRVVIRILAAVSQCGLHRSEC